MECPNEMYTAAPLPPLDDHAFAPQDELELTYRDAPVGMCVLDRDLRYVRINRCLAQINGLPVEVHLGRTVAELLPAMAEQVRNVIDRILATGEPVKNEEFQGETPAAPGVTRFWCTSWFPVRDDNGEIVRFGLVVEETTERRRAEERLRESEQRQRFLLELNDRLRPLAVPAEIQYEAARALGERLGASRVGYAEDRGDGETIEVTRNYTDGVPGIEGLYRYADYGATLLSELRSGRTVLRGDIPSDPTLSDEEKAAHAALQLRATANVPLVKGGRLVAVLFVHYGGAHEWSADEVSLLEAVAERTWAAVERARAEQALREAVERYERQVRLFDGVASTTPDFVYLFDLNGRFIYANRRLLEVWGLTLPEVIGRTCRELGYEQWHHDMHMREIAQVIATKRTIKGEVPFRAPLTGVFGVYEYIFTPVLGPDGETELIAGTTRDITERKRIEEALREADRRKDEFLAILAHELRNPLAPILTGVQVLRLKPGQGEHGNSGVLTMMERQVQHMSRLLDDLLDVSRITRGKIELRREHVELAHVVQAAVEANLPLIEQMRHSLEVHLPSKPVLLDADPVRLSQVFSNLLNNAAKYMDPDGRIELTAEQTDDRVVVSVIDRGIGIPAERLGSVFEMFSQEGGSLARSQGGLGIGLSLVKGLVALHGGSVEARSDGPGHGSTFVVRLPIFSDPQSCRANSAPVVATMQRKILVVDDNRDAAFSLALLLETVGNEVRVCHDGGEALRVAGEFAPQVVLLDLGMPNMDGYEVCRRLRDLPGGAAMTVIAVTGWGQEDDRRRTLAAGFDGHLVKPVDADSLLKMLGELSETASQG